MPNSSFLTIDLDKIRAQIDEIRACHGEIMPMIKANAYGTDPLTIARYFESCPIPLLGVSHVSEGIYLRKHGISLPIFVLSAPPFEAAAIAEYDLQAAISSKEELEALNAAAIAPLAVHLNVNTGMNRFGVPEEDALEMAQRIENAPNLKLVGILSHLAASDDLSLHAFSQSQISRFHSIVQALPKRPQWVHIGCTGSLEGFNLEFCNLVRIGRALFEDAFTLQSRIAAITHAEPGETVGYGRIHNVVNPNTRIAVLPIGYYDGYPRIVSPEGYVLIHGQKAPIMGRVCMDFMMVDVTGIPQASVGDFATLISAELPLPAVAEWAHTNPREILAHMNTRIERRYISHDPERLQHALRTLQKDPVAR